MKKCLAALALVALVSHQALADHCAAPVVKKVVAPVVVTPSYGHHAAAVVAPVVKHHDAAVLPIAVYVPVPLFTAQSPPAAAALPVPGAAPAPPAQASEEMRQVLDVLKSFDGRLKALEARSPAPAPAAQPAPAAAVPAPAPAPAAPPATPPAEAPPADPFSPDGKSAAVRAPAGASAGLSVVVSKCASCHDKVSGPKLEAPVFFDGQTLIVSRERRARMADSILKGRMPDPQSPIKMTAEEKVLAVAFLKS